MSNLGRTVAYEGSEWIVTNEVVLLDGYVYQLWSDHRGLTKVYHASGLPVVTDEVRELAAERRWTIEYAARYHGGYLYWSAWTRLWDRNGKRGKRGSQKGKSRTKHRRRDEHG